MPEGPVAVLRGRFGAKTAALGLFDVTAMA